ncbi:MAG: glutathione synthase [Gammaproteobacteria bacterium]|nr:MAG: glutathione synthase [Gammaproteobacteria bacterium]
MSISIGVVMDPIETLNYKKDTTLAMLWAAQDRGWSLFYMRQQDLYLDQGVAKASWRALEVRRDPADFYTLGEAQEGELSALDVVLMRKDPPFDPEYVYSTYILEAAEREGTLIVNRCQSLRDCNEKVFATQFPDCCPPVLVSRDSARLKAFYEHHGDVIFKPLEGMGGTSIFRVKQGDPNLSVILETLTRLGNETIMAQAFIPDISNGDKRILMLDGQPVPHCLARIPAEGETRGNLAAGGIGVALPLSQRDREIAARVGPILRKKGLIFAGLDVIGDYLTEINVTSPTCIREIDDAFDSNIAADLMAVIAQKIGAA